MAVNVTYQEPTSNMDETLLYAQIIADAFAKALDSNSCNVKILVGFAEEIEQERSKLEDIISMVEDPLQVILPPKVADTSNPTMSDIYNDLSSPEYTAENIERVSKKIKESCFDCKLAFPTIDFNANFSWAFDKLKALLRLFTDTFKKVLNPNFCHVAGAFTYSCIPSIISLIMLLISAYSAILALKKLGGFSLDAFIQGVISGLLGQLLGSFSIRVDTSKTGIACLIEALREIANELAGQASTVSGIVPESVLEELGYRPKVPTPQYNAPLAPEAYASEEEAEAAQQQYLEEKAAYEAQFVRTDDSLWSYQGFLEVYASMTGSEQSIVDQYLDQIQKENNNLNKNISKAFKDVVDVVDSVQERLNEDLANMFGLLEHFQCESERSGPGFADIFEYVNKLMTVINLLSAILSIIAKKQIKKMCKTKTSIDEMITVLEDAPVGEALTELEQIEIIEEFLERVVEVTEGENNELVPIIYEKEREPLLPKLKITDCNLNEFISGHSLENIVKVVVEEIRAEEEAEEERKLSNYTPKKPEGRVRVPSSSIVDKDKWSVYPIKFEKPLFTTTRIDGLDKDILAKDLESDAGMNAGIQTILELVYNNPLDNKKKVNKTESHTPTTSTPTDTDDIKNKDYREFIKAPLSVDTTKKQAFQNKCKDIDDVLNILGSINK